MTFRVCLPTSEPDEPGLVDFVRSHQIKRELVPETANTGFEEYWYYHSDRDELESLILDFWGPDNGNDLVIEEVGTEYRVHWSECPHNQHTSKVFFVEAVTREKAEAIARDHIERAFGTAWYTIFSIEAYTKPTGGRVL